MSINRCLSPSVVAGFMLAIPPLSLLPLVPASKCSEQMFTESWCLSPFVGARGGGLLAWVVVTLGGMWRGDC